MNTETSDKSAAQTRQHPQGSTALQGRPLAGQGIGQPVSESELLASAQRRFEGIRGEFAVAGRDGVGAPLFAVDRFGMETLCWREEGGHVLSSHDAQALARDGIDPQALFDYLYFHVVPSPRTVWRGVNRLPPGRLLRQAAAGPELQPYWVPRFEAVQQPDLPRLASEFRDLLQKSVGEQLDGGKPGCFLSGGTDSSTVAGMIGRATGRKAATYSIGFDAQGYDEMAFARLAAKHFDTEHHEYYVTPADVVAAVPLLAARFDQPFGNSSVLPAHFCARMAREDGVTRLLAGDGGDELFGGNARYAKQSLFAFYDAMPGVLRTVLEPLVLNPLVKAIPMVRKAHSYVGQARLPMPARLETYNLLHRLGTANVLTREFLAQVDAQAPARHQAAVWAEAETDSRLNRQLAYDWRYTLAETDLPKVRQACAAAQMAVGYPMLDQRLVDFSMSLPDDYKLKGQYLRWFFKEALRGFLPDDIINKPKQGFGLPFGPWLTTDDALRRFAGDAVHGTAARGIVRPEFARQLLDDFLPQHPGYYGEMIWILMMLEHWLRAHAPGYRV